MHSVEIRTRSIGCEEVTSWDAGWHVVAKHRWFDSRTHSRLGLRILCERKKIKRVPLGSTSSGTWSLKSLPLTKVTILRAF